MSLALARKYRPNSFSDLVGQESVSQTLSQALDGKRLSHAYLFSGLRGSGKTSTARIFAKSLLCEKGESAHPCNECSHCMMANGNRHMDIIEMDAASNRGIDDIKELIEHTKYKPSSARYKIFIIDEVHMLTPQAFNALLKTLEEPPSFIKFILATTDPLKLPTTILSRTQHFRFKKIAPKLVLQHLEHILNKEGIEYEREALEIIVRSGAGSLRDSLTLLDQAIVYSKNFVDISTVTQMLGIIEPSKLEELLDSILAKDHEKILSFIKQASGYETGMVVDELTLFLKEMLLARNPKLSALIIDRFFRILSDTKSLLSIGADEEFILSLTLFKMMEALEIRDIDTMIKSLEKELKGIQISPTKVAATTQQGTKDISEPKEILPVALPQIQQDASAHNAKEFEKLAKKIYDRDYDLGSCFERNIEFVGYENNTLTWSSTATGGDREILKNYWSVIKMFVQEIYGIETKIAHIAKKNEPPLMPHSQEEVSNAEPIQNRESHNEPPQEPIDYETSSMIEDIELGSSCIMPPAGETEAAKEKEPSEILKEPMVEEMLSLFEPKRVTIKRKV